MFGLPLAVVPGPDYSGAISDAVAEGTGVLTDNILVLFALPALWVGYKVVRKIIGKVA